MNQILLHICCGVCACSVIERLREDGFEPMGFFYNPNIHPEEEYKRRLGAVRVLSEAMGFSLIEGSYEKERWLELTRGFEKEPERGNRCEVCFSLRLEKTSQKSKELKIPFTTTLTVSTHKDSQPINRIGKGFEGFREYNFKKKDGFKRSLDLAKRYNLYHQNYCGCVYSQFF
ncbi:MAG: epoxyqueuosine reductase QueH [bacterium]|nr:epoxyqueuosine reductase QueH [bacterium]